MCSIGGAAECLVGVGLDPTADPAEEPDDDVLAVARLVAPRDRLRTLPRAEELLPRAEGGRAEDTENSVLSDGVTELSDPSLPCLEEVLSSLMLVILEVGC